VEEQLKASSGDEPTAIELAASAETEELFQLDRRRRNVQGLSAGVLATAATILLFVPVEWFLMRTHFALLQSLTLIWIAMLTGTWVLLRRRPERALRHIDNLVFFLFLFVSTFNHLLCWLDTGYDSPYTLTLLFVLIGVNFFISWSAARSAAFGLSVYALFVTPLLMGLVPLGDARIATLYQGVLVGTALILIAFQRHRLGLERSEFYSRLEVQKTKASLQQAFEQLQEVDRLKSEFFANVSHELRTPLTLILSPVDELLGKLRPSAERDALKVVRRNATRLLRMIDDLLDLARLEAGGLRLRIMQFDPCDLARRVAENAMPAARAKGVDLSFDGNCAPAERYGDPHRIEIILTNLIGNAVKFTPNGGQIQVSVFHNSAGTSVDVTDTGPGVPREEQERIFERFHQTETSERRQQGGVGIGLALARDLAQLHGGSLTVDSKLGSGSTFTLFLKSGKDHFHTEMIERRQLQMDLHPGRRIEDRMTGVHTRPMEQATAELRQSQRPPERVLLDRGRVPRILVAEDEVDLRGFIVGVLKESYTVDAAADGTEALELLKQHRPDLVLTDVMMPGTSGLDLCRAIKQDPSLRHIPVILLTARGENEAALEGYEAGADDFVSKPFHTKVLQARIHAHLKMRGLNLQLADQARLASAGTLAAGLAHEVKNPLNAAVNAAKVLEKGGSTRVSNEKLTGLIIDALQRIDGIVSALDAHARPADGTDLAPCNVRKAVESTLTLLEHKMKRVTVHEDYEVTGDVFAPARAFNQVLLNLLDNSARSGAENIWIELRQMDKQVTVTVADDGPGVPPDMVHRIFDPFFTTRVEGEGTGLGLHLSRRIAQECGGELRYEPRPGGGARFVMEIPAMEQAA
jgi:signal transduction histidine kinase